MNWSPDIAQTISRRWFFFVELEEGTESLLRTLGPFSTKGVEVTAVVLLCERGMARLEVTTKDLDAMQAARLRARIAEIPTVRSASLGWRLIGGVAGA